MSLVPAENILDSLRATNIYFQELEKDILNRSYDYIIVNNSSSSIIKEALSYFIKYPDELDYYYRLEIEPVKRVVEYRRRLYEFVTAKGVKKSINLIRNVADVLKKGWDINSRNYLSLEYELSLMGVSPIDGEVIVPFYLKEGKEGWEREIEVEVAEYSGVWTYIVGFEEELARYKWIQTTFRQIVCSWFDKERFEANLKDIGIDVGFFEGKDILEVGANRGDLFNYLNEKVEVKSYVGIDWNLDILTARGNRPLYAVNNKFIPFKDNSFDVVVFDSFLGPTYPEEVERLLRNGGAEVVTGDERKEGGKQNGLYFYSSSSLKEKEWLDIVLLSQVKYSLRKIKLPPRFKIPFINDRGELISLIIPQIDNYIFTVIKWVFYDRSFEKITLNLSEANPFSKKEFKEGYARFFVDKERKTAVMGFNRELALYVGIFREKGLGSAMLSLCVEEAYFKGVEKFILWHPLPKTAVLCKKLGFSLKNCDDRTRIMELYLKDTSINEASWKIENLAKRKKLNFIDCRNRKELREKTGISSSSLENVSEELKRLFAYIAPEGNEELFKEYLPYLDEVDNTLKKFLEKEVSPQLAAEWDKIGSFKDSNGKLIVPQGFLDVLKHLGELGFFGMCVPSQHGGASLEHYYNYIMLRRLSYFCPALAVTLVVNISLEDVINVFGTKIQKERYLPLLAKGGIGALCITEPDAGSDVMGIKTHARKVERGYILNGTKTFITNAGIADVYLVFAVTSKGIKKEISAFLVDKGTPGLSVGTIEKKLGQRASPTGEVILDNCCIPTQSLVGKEGEGMRIIYYMLSGGRIGIASLALGIAEAAYDAAYSYARARKQFRKTIVELPLTARKFLVMKIFLEAIKVLIGYAAYLKDTLVEHMNMHALVTIASVAKLFSSESANWIVREALQIHGGYGYIKDYPLERYLRDVVITTIYEGTSEIQRILVKRNIDSVIGSENKVYIEEMIDKFLGKGWEEFLFAENKNIVKERIDYLSKGDKADVADMGTALVLTRLFLFKSVMYSLLRGDNKKMVGENLDYALRWADVLVKGFLSPKVFYYSSSPVVLQDCNAVVESILSTITSKIALPLIDTYRCIIRKRLELIFRIVGNIEDGADSKEYKRRSLKEVCSLHIVNPGNFLFLADALMGMDVFLVCNNLSESSVYKTIDIVRHFMPVIKRAAGNVHFNEGDIRSISFDKNQFSHLTFLDYTSIINLDIDEKDAIISNIASCVCAPGVLFTTSNIITSEIIWYLRKRGILAVLEDSGFDAFWCTGAGQIYKLDNIGLGSSPLRDTVFIDMDSLRMRPQFRQIKSFPHIKIPYNSIQGRLQALVVIPHDDYIFAIRRLVTFRDGSLRENITLNLSELNPFAKKEMHNEGYCRFLIDKERKTASLSENGEMGIYIAIHRDMGLGSTLMSLAIEEVFSNNILKFIVYDPLPKAINFYKYLGFETINRYIPILSLNNFKNIKSLWGINSIGREKGLEFIDYRSGGFGENDSLSSSPVKIGLLDDEPRLKYYFEELARRNLELIRLTAQRTHLEEMIRLEVFVAGIHKMVDDEEDGGKEHITLIKESRQFYERKKTVEEKLIKLAKGLEDFSRTIKPIHYPKGYTNGRKPKGWINAKLSQAAELIRAKREPAANAVLVSIAAEFLKGLSVFIKARSKATAKKRLVVLDKKTMRPSVIQGYVTDYPVSKNNSTKFTIFKPVEYDYVYDAFRAIDHQISGEINELTWLRGVYRQILQITNYLDTHYKNSRKHKPVPADVFKMMQNVFSGIVLGLNKSILSNKEIIRYSVELALELIAIEKMNPARSILGVTLMFIESRANEVKRIVKNIQKGRLTALRALASKRNKKVIYWITDLLESAKEQKDYKTLVKLYQFKNSKEIDAYFKEPEFWHINRKQITGYCIQLIKHHKKDEALKRLGMIMRAVKEVEETGHFMQKYRNFYIQRNVDERIELSEEKAFTMVFDTFIKDNNLNRGSPQSYKWWTVFYRTAFIPARAKDPKNSFTKIRNPLFLAAAALINIKAAEKFRYLFRAFAKSMPVTVQLLRRFSDKNKTNYYQLSLKEKGELLRALSLDWKLDNTEKKIIVLSANITNSKSSSALKNNNSFKWDQGKATGENKILTREFLEPKSREKVFIYFTEDGIVAMETPRIFIASFDCYKHFIFPYIKPVIFAVLNSNTAMFTYLTWSLAVILALERMDLRKKTIVDAGCGEGVVLLAAALFGANKVIGIERSLPAYRISKSNFKRNKIKATLINSNFNKVCVNENIDVTAINLANFGVYEFWDLENIFSHSEYFVFSGAGYDNFVSKKEFSFPYAENVAKERFRERGFEIASIVNLIEDTSDNQDYSIYPAFIAKRIKKRGKNIRQGGFYSSSSALIYRDAYKYANRILIKITSHIDLSLRETYRDIIRKRIALISKINDTYDDDTVEEDDDNNLNSVCSLHIVNPGNFLFLADALMGMDVTVVVNNSNESMFSRINRIISDFRAMVDDAGGCIHFKEGNIKDIYFTDATQFNHFTFFSYASIINLNSFDMRRIIKGITDHIIAPGTLFVINNLVTDEIVWQLRRNNILANLQYGGFNALWHSGAGQIYELQEIDAANKSINYKSSSSVTRRDKQRIIKELNDCAAAYLEYIRLEDKGEDFMVPENNSWYIFNSCGTGYINIIPLADNTILGKANLNSDIAVGAINLGRPVSEYPYTIGNINFNKLSQYGLPNPWGFMCHNVYVRNFPDKKERNNLWLSRKREGPSYIDKHRINHALSMLAQSGSADIIIVCVYDGNTERYLDEIIAVANRNCKFTYTTLRLVLLKRYSPASFIITRWGFAVADVYSDYKIAVMPWDNLSSRRNIISYHIIDGMIKRYRGAEKIFAGAFSVDNKVSSSAVCADKGYILLNKFFVRLYIKFDRKYRGVLTFKDIRLAQETYKKSFTLGKKALFEMLAYPFVILPSHHKDIREIIYKLEEESLMGALEFIYARASYGKSNIYDIINGFAKLSQEFELYELSVKNIFKDKMLDSLSWSLISFMDRSILYSSNVQLRMAILVLRELLTSFDEEIIKLRVLESSYRAFDSELVRSLIIREIHDNGWPQISRSIPEPPTMHYIFTSNKKDLKNVLSWVDKNISILSSSSLKNKRHLSKRYDTIRKIREIYKPFYEKDSFMAGVYCEDKISISMSAKSDMTRMWLAQEIMDEYDGGVVLSVGMGSAVLEEELADNGVSVLGVDVVYPLLNRAKKKKVSVILADGNKLPFRSESISAVVFPESIGHFDLDFVLTEAYRVLCDEGFIHISTYSPGIKLWQKFEYKLYYPYEILNVLKRLGIKYNKVKPSPIERNYFYLRAQKQSSNIRYPSSSPLELIPLDRAKEMAASKDPIEILKGKKSLHSYMSLEYAFMRNQKVDFEGLRFFRAFSDSQNRINRIIVPQVKENTIFSTEGCCNCIGVVGAQFRKASEIKKGYVLHQWHKPFPGISETYPCNSHFVRSLKEFIDFMDFSDRSIETVFVVAYREDVEYQIVNIKLFFEKVFTAGNVRFLFIKRGDKASVIGAKEGYVLSVIDKTASLPLCMSWDRINRLVARRKFTFVAYENDALKKVYSSIDSCVSSSAIKNSKDGVYPYYFFNKGRGSRREMWGLFEDAVLRIRRRFAKGEINAIRILSFGGVRRLNGVPTISEAHQIIIAFLEDNRKHLKEWNYIKLTERNLKVVVTDDNINLLNEAQKGVYARKHFMVPNRKPCITKATEEMLNRYFVKTGRDKFQVKKEVGKFIETQPQAYLKLRPAKNEKFDLILYNFYEYIIEEKQKKFLPIQTFIIASNMLFWFKNNGFLITTAGKWFNSFPQMREISKTKATFWEKGRTTVYAYLMEYVFINYNKAWFDDEYMSLCNKISEYKSDFNKNLLDIAYHFAKKVHYNVKREHGESYLAHPLRIVSRIAGDERFLNIISDLGLSLEVFFSCVLLHDVLEEHREKGNLFWLVVKMFFSFFKTLRFKDAYRIMSTTFILTRREKTKEDYLKRVYESGSFYAIAIKIFDRIDNFIIPRYSWNQQNAYDYAHKLDFFFSPELFSKNDSFGDIYKYYTFMQMNLFTKELEKLAIEQKVRMPLKTRITNYIAEWSNPDDFTVDNFRPLTHRDIVALVHTKRGKKNTSRILRSLLRSKVVTQLSEGEIVLSEYIDKLIKTELILPPVPTDSGYQDFFDSLFRGSIVRSLRPSFDYLIRAEVVKKDSDKWFIGIRLRLLSGVLSQQYVAAIVLDYNRNTVTLSSRDTNAVKINNEEITFYEINDGIYRKVEHKISLFYQELFEQLTESISIALPEGFIFVVDERIKKEPLCRINCPVSNKESSSSLEDKISKGRIPHKYFLWLRREPSKVYWKASDYNETLSTSDEQFSAQKKVYNIVMNKGKASILDLGAGRPADFLVNLSLFAYKAGIRDKINLYGIDIDDPVSFRNLRERGILVYGGIPAESLPSSWGQKFDLIVSHVAASTYSKHPLLVFEETFRVLAVDGEAYLDIQRDALPFVNEKEEFRSVKLDDVFSSQRKQGITIKIKDSINRDNIFVVTMRRRSKEQRLLFPYTTDFITDEESEKFILKDKKEASSPLTQKQYRYLQSVLRIIELNTVYIEKVSWNTMTSLDLDKVNKRIGIIRTAIKNCKDKEFKEVLTKNIDSGLTPLYWGILNISGEVSNRVKRMQIDNLKARVEQCQEELTKMLDNHTISKHKRVSPKLIIGPYCPFPALPEGNDKSGHSAYVLMQRNNPKDPVSSSSPVNLKLYQKAVFSIMRIFKRRHSTVNIEEIAEKLFNKYAFYGLKQIKDFISVPIDKFAHRKMLYIGFGADLISALYIADPDEILAVDTLPLGNNDIIGNDGYPKYSRRMRHMLNRYYYKKWRNGYVPYGRLKSIGCMIIPLFKELELIGVRGDDFRIDWKNRPVEFNFKEEALKGLRLKKIFILDKTDANSVKSDKDYRRLLKGVNIIVVKALFPGKLSKRAFNLILKRLNSYCVISDQELPYSWYNGVRLRRYMIKGTYFGNNSSVYIYIKGNIRPFRIGKRIRVFISNKENVKDKNPRNSHAVISSSSSMSDNDLSLRLLYRMQKMFTAYNSLLSEYGIAMQQRVNDIVNKINGPPFSHLPDAVKKCTAFMPDVSRISIIKNGKHNWIHWFDYDTIDITKFSFGQGCIDPCWFCIRDHIKSRAIIYPLPVLIYLIKKNKGNRIISGWYDTEPFLWFDPFFGVSLDGIIEFIARSFPDTIFEITTRGMDSYSLPQQETAKKIAGLADKYPSLKNNVFNLSFHLCLSGFEYDIIRAVSKRNLNPGYLRQVQENYICRYTNIMSSLRNVIKRVYIYSYGVHPLFEIITERVFAEVLKRLNSNLRFSIERHPVKAASYKGDDFIFRFREAVKDKFVRASYLGINDKDKIRRINIPQVALYKSGKVAVYINGKVALKDRSIYFERSSSSLDNIDILKKYIYTVDSYIEEYILNTRFSLPEYLGMCSFANGIIAGLLDINFKDKFDIAASYATYYRVISIFGDDYLIDDHFFVQAQDIKTKKRYYVSIWDCMIDILSRKHESQSESLRELFNIIRSIRSPVIFPIYNYGHLRAYLHNPHEFHPAVINKLLFQRFLDNYPRMRRIMQAKTSSSLGKTKKQKFPRSYLLNKYKKETGAIIKQKIAQKMSINEFSAILGAKPEVVKRFLEGKKSLSVKRLHRIAKILDTAVVNMFPPAMLKEAKSNFGLTVQFLRILAGLETREFASLCGISQGAISLIERGNRSSPRDSTIKKITRTFHRIESLNPYSESILFSQDFLDVTFLDFCSNRLAEESSKSYTRVTITLPQSSRRSSYLDPLEVIYNHIYALRNKKKNIKLKVEKTKDGVFHVDKRVGRESLRLVLEELLDNAVEASEGSYIKITFDKAKISNGIKKVIISIENEGSINYKLLRKIFLESNLFSEIHTPGIPDRELPFIPLLSTKALRSGGMGLPLVREQIREWGEMLKIETGVYSSSALSLPKDKIAVIAMGGNAFSDLSSMVENVVNMITAGYSVLLTHGNGPQIGKKWLDEETLTGGDIAKGRGPVLTAETQADMGYEIVQKLTNAGLRRGIEISTAVIISRVTVDKNDHAFIRKNWSKPVGPYYDKNTAHRLERTKGWKFVFIPDKGWRRVVPSPFPNDILEKEAIISCLNTGIVVVAGGGGGIPVVLNSDGSTKGVDATIDKDLLSAVILREVIYRYNKKGILIILTDVPCAYLDFGKPEQRRIGTVNVKEAKSYLSKGHFSKGSMEPKVKACINAIRWGAQKAIITNSANLFDALGGKEGTTIVKDNSVIYSTDKDISSSSIVLDGKKLLLIVKKIKDAADNGNSRLIFRLYPYIVEYLSFCFDNAQYSRAAKLVSALIENSKDHKGPLHILYKAGLRYSEAGKILNIINSNIYASPDNIFLYLDKILILDIVREFDYPKYRENIDILSNKLSELSFDNPVLLKTRWLAMFIVILACTIETEILFGITMLNDRLIELRYKMSAQYPDIVEQDVASFLYLIIKESIYIAKFFKEQEMFEYSYGTLLAARNISDNLCALSVNPYNLETILLDRFIHNEIERVGRLIFASSPVNKTSQAIHSQALSTVASGINNLNRLFSYRVTKEDGELNRVSSSALADFLFGLVHPVSKNIDYLREYIGQVSPIIYKYTEEKLPQLYPFVCKFGHLVLFGLLRSIFNETFYVYIFKADYFGRTVNINGEIMNVEEHVFLTAQDKATGVNYYVSIFDIMFDVLNGRYKGKISCFGDKYSDEIVSWANKNRKIIIFKIGEDIFNDKKLIKYLHLDQKYPFIIDYSYAVKSYSPFIEEFNCLFPEAKALDNSAYVSSSIFNEPRSLTESKIYDFRQETIKPRKMLLPEDKDGIAQNAKIFRKNIWDKIFAYSFDGKPWRDCGSFFRGLSCSFCQGVLSFDNRIISRRSFIKKMLTFGALTAVNPLAYVPLLEAKEEVSSIIPIYFKDVLENALYEDKYWLYNVIADNRVMSNIIKQWAGKTKEYKVLSDNNLCDEFFNEVRAELDEAKIITTKDRYTPEAVEIAFMKFYPSINEKRGIFLRYSLARIINELYMNIIMEGKLNRRLVREKLKELETVAAFADYDLKDRLIPLIRQALHIILVSQDYSDEQIENDYGLFRIIKDFYLKKEIFDNYTLKEMFYVSLILMHDKHIYLFCKSYKVANIKEALINGKDIIKVYILSDIDRIINKNEGMHMEFDNYGFIFKNILSSNAGWVKGILDTAGKPPFSDIALNNVKTIYGSGYERQMLGLLYKDFANLSEQEIYQRMADAVSIHEIMHVVDKKRFPSGKNITYSDMSRKEISAYLAEIVLSKVPYYTLFELTTHLFSKTVADYAARSIITGIIDIAYRRGLSEDNVDFNTEDASQIGKALMCLNSFNKELLRQLAMSTFTGIFSRNIDIIRIIDSRN